MSSKSKNISQLDPLSEKELEELDDFLTSDILSDESMVISGLDGYLTAIASAPVVLKPSEWMLEIWGPTEDYQPEFESDEQAEHIYGLIIRHFNGIINCLLDNPDTFEPLFDEFKYRSRTYIEGQMWAYGYMQGIELCRSYWQPLFNNPDGLAALRPIYLLGAGDVTPEEEALTETPLQREKLSKQIPASVAWIYRFWLPYREAIDERTVATTIRRDQPKIGRNDPCPCGSGKKFKKCCGSAGTLH